MSLKNLKVTKIHNTPDGHSHFEDIDVPFLYSVGAKQRLSRPIGTAQFFEFEPDFYLDWHTSYKCVYFIYMQGAQEVEVSDGTKRKFFTGDIILAQDISGYGHRSWSISDQTGRAIIIDA